jgi:MinD-like ATPase involved in chromosome partitioning or flagellar assembly
MTESDWQGDMLRRMAEQPPADRPADSEPTPQAHPPAGPAQQQYPQQQYEQHQYQPAQPPQQQPPQQQPPQQPPYPPQQYPPQPPYQPQQYPPQQYEQQYPPQGQPPYHPDPYQQQYAPPSYPPPYQEPYPPQQPVQQPPYQAPYQPGPDQAWGAPPPPTPYSDQLGTPLPPEQQGDSVLQRVRRFASEAAYLVGASGRMQRDVDNIATIRRPIAIMRRVGVLSPVTNAGTSTVSALLAITLSAQRSDRVVAIDVDPAGAELSRRLEPSFGAGSSEGVTLVRAAASAAAIRSSLAEVQGQGARDVGVAVVDCPDTMYGEVSSELASSGHCTVLVLPSVRNVAEYALAQLDQLNPAGQNVLLQRGVVVISMVENLDPGTVEWLAEAFRARGLDPVVLPYDAHVAQGYLIRSEELRSDTRRALLELARRVIETVTKPAG